MKDTIRTIVVGLIFTLSMLASLILYFPVLILKLFKLGEQLENYSYHISSNWGRFCFFLNNTKMTVHGLENLPDHKNIVYIGNHQGYCDIPFIMANMPTMIGFIAKKELSKVPVMGIWMKVLHCIFLDRENFRKSMRDLETGIAEAAQGFPKVIFPEGTRSKGPKMGEFKAGSILLAAKAEITIVPVTINGTYKIWEEKKKLRQADLELTVHPFIDTKGMSEAEKKQLPKQLWNTISGALPDTSKGE
ncbi:MAG: lysophospholipid acyltransferase family protein [Spirochaetales bacterium]|nr:lysophospholipid acyltransferase family protein [Spirochaetales bacterium]